MHALLILRWACNRPWLGTQYAPASQWLCSCIVLENNNIVVQHDLKWEDASVASRYSLLTSPLDNAFMDSGKDGASGLAFNLHNQMMRWFATHYTAFPGTLRSYSGRLCQVQGGSAL